MDSMPCPVRLTRCDKAILTNREYHDNFYDNTSREWHTEKGRAGAWIGPRHGGVLVRPNSLSCDEYGLGCVGIYPVTKAAREPLDSDRREFVTIFVPVLFAGLPQTHA